VGCATVVDVAGPLVLAIDGNSLVHRSYHAQARTEQRNTDGRPTWAVRGLLTQLVAAVERVRPTAIVVGFDDSEASLRRDTWPIYKANRGEKLETLVEQLASAVEVLRELGVAVVVPRGLEADDVLASTAALVKKLNGATVIVTSDRDSFALIDDHTTVLRIINGGVEASPMLTPGRLVMLLGVRADQYRDFAALRGDASDNLSGVRGIGPQGAARLLTEFGSARAAFDDLDGVRTKLGAGIAAKLADPAARAAWELNCQVMAMHSDVELGLNFGSDDFSGDFDGSSDFSRPGILPLAPDRVASVFRGQNLTWSVADAMRVLANCESPPQPPPQAIQTGHIEASHAVDPRWAHTWPANRAGAQNIRPRLPKLAPARPLVEQLSLFD